DEHGHRWLLVCLAAARLGDRPHGARSVGLRHRGAVRRRLGGAEDPRVHRPGYAARAARTPCVGAPRGTRTGQPRAWRRKETIMKTPQKRRTSRINLARTLVVALMLLLTVGISVGAAADQALGGKFRTGGSVTIPASETVHSDLYVAGGTIRMD